MFKLFVSKWVYGDLPILFMYYYVLCYIGMRQ